MSKLADEMRELRNDVNEALTQVKFTHEANQWAFRFLARIDAALRAAEPSRDAALEEAATICEAVTKRHYTNADVRTCARRLADAIRALKSQPTETAAGKTPCAPHLSSPGLSPRETDSTNRISHEVDAAVLDETDSGAKSPPSAAPDPSRDAGLDGIVTLDMPRKVLASFEATEQPTPRDCKHGQLARSCEICDLIADNERYVAIAAIQAAEIDELERKLNAQSSLQSDIQKKSDEYLAESKHWSRMAEESERKLLAAQAEIEQAYPLIVAHVARRAINCAPSRSDNIGVSDRNIGFRDGWNAARDLMLDRIERELGIGK